jgi:hypothetical protein
MMSYSWCRTDYLSTDNAVTSCLKKSGHVGDWIKLMEPHKLVFSIGSANVRTENQLDLMSQPVILLPVNPIAISCDKGGVSA